MMHSASGWQFSQGFDLTFSTGMGYEHATAVLGSGKPDRKNLMTLAASFMIKAHQANAIFDQVIAAVSHWPKHAQKYGVLTQSVDSIENALNEIRRKL